MLLLTSCAAPDLHARAARLDARSQTAAYTWILEHAPSSLDVSGFMSTDFSPFDPGAKIRQVGREPRAACRRAARDRALLLISAPLAQASRRALALDCGYALERDANALVIAPR